MPTALYYRHDPFAPKPNQPTRFGSAVVVSCKGQILLEHRKDNFRWGVISGDIHDTESFLDCAIVSFLDGNIYRVVHMAYNSQIDEFPDTKVSKHSIELKWVDPMELEDYDIVVTHQEILEQYFIKYNIPNTLKKSIREQ